MTDPFSAGLVANLNGTTHAGKFRAVQGPAVSPKFFCCISGNTVGVDKDPVPVIMMSALIVCITEAITLDYSQSWSPTDTIATWDVDWGDGQASNGAWPGAGSIAHPLGGYAAAGKYDVTLTLEDTIGATNTSAVQVLAQDCMDPDEPEEIFPPARWANTDYLGGIAGGRDFVWRNPDVLGAGLWSKVETDQLSAAHIKDIRITRLPTGLEYMYVARMDGIYGYNVPPFEGKWTKFQDVEDLMTAAGASILVYDSTQTITSLAFVETKPGWGYAYWRANHIVSPFLGADAVCGVAFTRNGWQSISWSVIIDTMVRSFGDSQHFADGTVAVVQELGGQVAFASVGKTDMSVPEEFTRLYRTSNYGASWGLVDEYIDNNTSYVVIPHASQGYVYWGSGDVPLGTYRSTQYGAAGSFAQISLMGGMMSASPVDPRYLIFEAGGINTQMYEHIPGVGVRAYGPPWPAGAVLGFIVTERNPDNTVHAVMQMGGPPALIRMMYDDGTVNVVTGAWNPASFSTGAMGRPEAEEYLA